MPPTSRDLPRLDEACRALAAGRPVVLPNATPMAYIVVATAPRPVNALKGRPLEQNVGVTLGDERDWAALAPELDLTPGHLERVRALMERELLSFLVPLRPGAAVPAWIRPAVRDRWLALFAGSWAPLAPVWRRFPRLFGSSANRTGRPPATTAAEAAAAFGDDAVVVDGDALRQAGGTRGATTVLRATPDGGLALHRTGAHDAGLTPEAFLEQVAAG